MATKSFSTYDDYFNDWYESFLQLIKTPGYSRNPLTVRKWKTGFYENKVRNIHQRVRRLFKMKCGFTRYKAFLLFGKKEGLRRWEEYCKKQVETKDQKNWSMTEEELKEYNSRRACTLKNFIKRHGEEAGKQKWDEYVNRQKYTKSLDYYIEKYGPEEGPSKWAKTNKMKACTRENMVMRWGEEEGIKKYTNYISGKRMDFYSKEATSFFEKLEKELGKEMMYRPKNKELALITPDGVFCYDCFLAPDIIIEYNGSPFHGNPQIYKEDDCPNPFMKEITAKQMWEFDKKKIFAAVNNNYRVIIVWDTAAKKEEIFKEIKAIIEKDLIVEELI